MFINFILNVRKKKKNRPIKKFAPLTKIHSNGIDRGAEWGTPLYISVANDGALVLRPYKSLKERKN